MTDSLGQFQLLEHIDDGGSADVYRALKRETGDVVALKVLKPALRENPEEVSRFFDEARFTQGLIHPGIPSSLETGVEDGSPYLAMEFVQGESLADCLERCGKFAEEEALSIACDLADTLAYIHRHGVVHRDLKPANIVLRSSDGRAQIMDFGVARASGAGAEGHMATPRYMSPEQAAGDRVDGRSDLFSLGVILYEMLAGHPPFESSTLDALITEVRQTDPAPLSASHSKAAPVITQLLQKDPAKRYASAEAARDAMQHREGNAEAGRRPLGSAGWLAIVGLGVAMAVAWVLL